MSLMPKNSIMLLNDLQWLEIRECPELRFIIVNSTVSLSSLTYLGLDTIQDLVFLPKNVLCDNKHSKLLCIGNCPLLQSDGIFHAENNEKLPVLPCLELVVQGCHALNSLNFPSTCWSSLLDVQIEECRGLKSFPEGLSLLPHLQILRIGQFCEDLDNFPFPDLDQPQIQIDSHHQHYFTSLEILALVGWPKLKSLPHQLQHLKKLKALLIEEFSGLITLPDWLGGLVLLYLFIYSCENLTHLPSKEAMLRLTLLEEFEIKKLSSSQRQMQQGQRGP